MFLGTRLQRVAAAVTVTVVTVAIIGVVLMSNTPLGCGPAKAMHMTLSSAHCQTVASIIPSPSPFARPTTTNPTLYTPPPYTPPATNNPFPPPDSNNNPVPPPVSNPQFPPNPMSGSPFNCGSSCAGISPGLALNCRLPVYANGPGSGGFVIFPSGTFQPDPRSAVTVPSPSPAASPAPVTGGYGPYYQGWWGSTYDRAYSKWLPVPYAWVTPNGKRYAYPGTPDGVYVQDVSNWTQVELAEGKSWQIIDVDAAGVYAVTGPIGGLWFLPFAGGITQITSTGFWQSVANGAAYGTATSSVPNGASNTILKLDIKTGTSIDWFTRPGGQSQTFGFDWTGSPVVTVNSPNGLEIWIASQRNNASLIEVANQGNGINPNGLPVADSHGLWFSSYQGIALYGRDGVWYWMSGLGASLAGGCA